jgi:hypothetical protein
VASSNESNKQTDLILVSTDAALVQELISLANMQNLHLYIAESVDTVRDVIAR